MPMLQHVKGLAALIAVFVCLPLLAASSAAQTASQDVTIVVKEVNVLAVSSSEVLLTVEKAEAGGAPVAASNASTSYSITTNGAAKKISAAINAPYPEGIKLKVALAAPDGGASTGPRVLSTDAVDVVTDLSRVIGSDLPIAYEAVVSPQAAPTTGETRTVVFTIMDM